MEHGGVAPEESGEGGAISDHVMQSKEGASEWMNKNIETLNEIKPILRSLAAFAIYLRYGLEPNVAYVRADVFLKQ